MQELPPDLELNANKTTYTYDRYDRVFIKNYYFRTEYYFNGSNSETPKKLLYQDLYKYKNDTNNTPIKIERIYQPIISTPEIVRNGNNVTVSSTFVCKTPVWYSGFVISTDYNFIKKQTLYPDGQLSNGNPTYQRNLALGSKSYTFTQASTVYVKAYCAVETGVLFSRLVSI